MPMALALRMHLFENSDVSETTVFKNCGVQKANMLMSTVSPQLDCATLHSVEASEVTQKSSRVSRLHSNVPTNIAIQ